MLTFDAALAELRAAERFGTHPSLEGTRALAHVLGDPQNAYRTIQITGTNGKSSTTRLIAALLQAHGLRTGAYLSPELESVTERIQIGGTPASETDFARAISVACEARARAWETGALPEELTVTQFELLTVASFWLFRARRVQVAALEVGMGGRWDATSVANPTVAVVTGVGIDHTEQLGDSREAIAADKSNIVKPGSVAVLGPGTTGVEGIFAARARAVGAGVVAVREQGETSPVVEPRTVRYEVVEHPHAPGGSMRVRVKGMFCEYAGLVLRAPAYQAANVATAIAAIEVFFGCGLDADATYAALLAIDFPGRFELLSDDPVLVIDGAHNPQAAWALADAIEEAFPDPLHRPTLLLGILADKDARGIVEALAPVAGTIVVTSSASPRAMEAEALAVIVEEVAGRRPEVFADVATALETLAGRGSMGLVVTGSITTAGEARGWTKARAGASSDAGNDGQVPSSHLLESG
jgi:dihydrofolate synthase/folylpolyglutamate synthase